MKICPLLLQYDYGLAGKGISLEKKIFLPALESIFESCVPFWLEDHGFWTDIDKLQQNILDFVAQEKPDIVFTVLMEYEIRPQTLKKMKDDGIFVVNFFCDTTWRWEWVKKIAPSLSCAFDTDLYSLHKYKSIGCEAQYCQWGGYEYFEKPLNEPYKYDVSFVGSKNYVREWYVETLLPEFKVECFGNGWKNGKCELKDVIPYSKINLNLSNSLPKDTRFWQWANSKGLMVNSGKVIEQIKLRHFEIPALGGFQIAHHAIGTPEGIETYGDIDDMKRLISYYLESPRLIHKPNTFEENLNVAFNLSL